MTIKMYNDCINKMDIIIFDATEKLVEIIKETLFDDVKEIELKKYFNLGERDNDYDYISRVALRNEEIWVYFPSYIKECAWIRLTTFTPTQIVSVYKELCRQAIKNK